MRRLRLRGDRGSAAVEFAIVIPVLLLLVLGTVEFGRVLFLQNSITNAARVGARTMAIEASSASTSAGQATAVADAKAQTVSAASVAPALTIGQVTVSTSNGTSNCALPPDGSAVYVTVSIAYPVTQVTGFLPVFPTALSAKASARCDG